MLKVRVHSAEVEDREGIKLLLEIAARDPLPKRLSQLWMDASLHRRREGCRLGTEGAWSDGRDSTISTEAGSG